MIMKAARAFYELHQIRDLTVGLDLWPAKHLL